MCHPGLVPGIYEILKRVQHDGLGNKKTAFLGSFFIPIQNRHSGLDPESLEILLSKLLNFYRISDDQASAYQVAAF